MYKAIVFAGTTEGCEICDFLARNKIRVCACVATEYGSKSLKENEYLHVMAGRLSEDEMVELFEKEKPELVLDATHPYAREVTSNIVAACVRVNSEVSDQQGKPAYVRVLRAGGGRQKQAIYVDSTEDAVEYLKNTVGNILLTTGSKELAQFTKLPDYENRIYARVLSLVSVMETCREYGIEGKHLIGMQGPFSKEMNVAMLRQYDCRYLVTKDSGKAGGFPEKIEAADACGVIPVIIGRPSEDTGISCGECKKRLAKQFGFSMRPHVVLVGIGMGSQDTLTLAGKRAVEQATLLIGAKRVVDAVKLPYQDVHYEYRDDEIVKYIEHHPEYEHIVVVLSGDTGFYSGARKLLEALKKVPQSCESDQDSFLRNKQIEIVCGISSVAYFMSKTGLSWDDAKLASVHGRDCNLIALIRQNEKVFAILGTKTGVSELAKKLEYYHMGDVLLYVGENLSYENEKIFVKRAEELTDYEGDSLCVVCAYHKNVQPALSTHGICDEEFVRGKAPMTKEEVRTVSLAKLRLEEESICYDVGAGTGSVSIEMALRASQGRVYAIEKKDEAIQLLHANKQKYAADNLEIIEGLAPEALNDLPVPTHAFIGGSSGNMREILQVLVEKNPNVRIVINCITLETVTETLKSIEEIGFAESEIVQIGVSRAKILGGYHMMMGENPIYVITCQYLNNK